MGNVSNSRTDYGQLSATASKNSQGWIEKATKDGTTFNVLGLHIPRTPLFTDETKLQAELQRLRDLQQQVQKAIEKAANIGTQMSDRLS